MARVGASSRARYRTLHGESPSLAPGSEILPLQEEGLLQRGEAIADSLGEIIVSLKNILGPLQQGEGLIGQAVEGSETTYGEGEAGDDYLNPTVCIPLRVADRPIGAIAIHSLLQQKDGFTALDRELFTLLAGHAATSIFAAQLYGQSARKLNTIQGFIDLLTK